MSIFKSGQAHFFSGHGNKSAGSTQVNVFIGYIDCRVNQVRCFPSSSVRCCRVPSSLQRLLQGLEMLVWDHHCLVPACTPLAHADVEERIVQGHADRVVAVALGLPACGASEGVGRLLRVPCVLLAAVARRLLLTRLQIKTKVGRGPVAGRLHTQFLGLAHSSSLADGRLLSELLLLRLLLTRRVRLCVWVVHHYHLAARAVANEKAAVEWRLFHTRHVQLGLLG